MSHSKNVSAFSDAGDSLLHRVSAPMLSADEEMALARSWREHGDIAARDKIIFAHVRLVNKLARYYAKRSDISFRELQAAGMLGLVEATRKFDPNKDNTFATFATYDIRDKIMQVAFDSRSTVRVATTHGRKKVFNNFSKARTALGLNYSGFLRPSDVEKVAEHLNVSANDVEEVGLYLSVRDPSLQDPVSKRDGAKTFEEALADQGPDQELVLCEANEFTVRLNLLEAALKTLDPRDCHIFTERRLREDPPELDVLAQLYGVSRSRIFQLEKRATEKVQQALLAAPLRSDNLREPEFEALAS